MAPILFSAKFWIFGPDCPPWRTVYLALCPRWTINSFGFRWTRYCGQITLQGRVFRNKLLGDFIDSYDELEVVYVNYPNNLTRSGWWRVAWKFRLHWCDCKIWKWQSLMKFCTSDYWCLYLVISMVFGPIRLDLRTIIILVLECHRPKRSRLQTKNKIRI